MEASTKFSERVANISTERLGYVSVWHKQQASKTSSHHDRIRHLQIASDYADEIDRRSWFGC